MPINWCSKFKLDCVKSDNCYILLVDVTDFKLRLTNFVFSKSVLNIKTRLVVTVELGKKWMPNSDSASNCMPEYKFLGY